MHPVTAYLDEIRLAGGAGVKETTHYPTLKSLLDAVGHELKPKVRCVVHPRNRGAGIPDIGLFTVDQLRRGVDDPLAAALPARAVIEAKGLAEEVPTIAESEQVGRYLDRYGLVLVTNYRDFALYERRGAGPKILIERYELADSAAAFMALAARSAQAVADRGDRFCGFLTRVALFGAPLKQPQDLAQLLASYAREAAARVAEADVPALAGMRQALEETLGLTFKEEKGEHFFRSTLVQTLFYGLFSAWVLWHHDAPDREDDFDWRVAAHHLKLPVIQALFEQMSDPSKLRRLGLLDVLNGAGAALNRVERPSFFASFDAGDAIQYFYEPFLQHFDPELRKSLGVWYTPREIVHYMVERVDRVLRDELGVRDGLADPQVVVLDPCAGTGAYLVEVLKRIATTLTDKGEGALVPSTLREAATQRIYGFEILPAPYVVAHLQIGLLLQQLHAPLGDDRRAALYLTNALTGWEAVAGEDRPLPQYPELAAERGAAENVKRKAPILVILGNPPYNAFAGVSPVEEKGLVEPYKVGLQERWRIRKFNLDDLYIRFFRLAERRIAELTGRGVVSFISNHSWVNEPSFVVLREHLLGSFDKFWIENMHGNRKISEYAPDGRTSETIFAIRGMSEGIQQGVAISLWVKSNRQSGKPVVYFRDDLNAAKADERRAALLASLDDSNAAEHYVEVRPDERNRFSFRPSDSGASYASWPTLEVLALGPPVTGYKENRGFSLIEQNRNILARRMSQYFDRDVPWEVLEELKTSLTKDAARYPARPTREKVIGVEQFDESRIMRYVLRPFEVRWCYYSQVRPLWNEPRPALFTHRSPGNLCIVSRPSGVAEPEGVPMYSTSQLADFDFMRGHSYHFPTHVNQAVTAKANQPSLGTFRSNLSLAVRTYLKALAVRDPDTDATAAALPWLHALAIGYSPAYLTENADGIRQDWPRIPLPAKREQLEASAALGQRIAGLLDVDTPVEGVTGGDIAPEYRFLGMVDKTDEGEIDLSVTAGWGHEGKAGVTMPGKGRVQFRDWAEGERVAGLGERVVDVYLNATTYWRNVPEPVWEYVIGGYQVIKKWLSYREAKLLGRPLTLDEAREVQAMVRRIAAIVRMQPELDASYEAVKADTYPWPAAKA